MSDPSADGGLLRAGLDLAEVGVRMHREFLRRERPDASEAELDALVRAWILQQHENEFEIPGFRKRHRKES